MPGQPGSIATGDLNGDARDDFVVASAATVCAFLRRADGGFDPGPVTTLPENVTQVGLADVDSDDVLDLFVLRDTTLSTLHGTGGGAFEPKSDFAVLGHPSGFVLADYSGDGQPDVATIGPLFPGIFERWHGDGTGLVSECAFPLWASYSGNLNITRLGTGDTAYAVGADGIFKILKPGRLGCGPVESSYSADCRTRWITSGDMDGDGLLDLAATSSNVVTIHPWVTPPGIHHLHPTFGGELRAVGDVDGDGNVDLVNANGTQVEIQKGNGDGSLSPGQAFDSGPLTYAQTLADFDHDGLLDLACSSGSFLRIFYNHGTGFSDYVDYAPSHAGGAEPGDFDGDGNLDIARADFDTVKVLFGDGAQGFDRTFQSDCLTRVNDMTVGDFDGDGRDDIAAVGSNSNGSGVTVLLGQADGTMLRVVQTLNYLPDATPLEAACADVNSDGLLDLVTISDRWVSISLGIGYASFLPRYAGPYLSNANSLQLRDVNLDGIPDLILCGCGGIRVFPGDGAGNFGKPTAYGGSATLFRDMVADLDGDHAPDLIANDGWTMLNGTTAYPMVSGAVGNGRIWPVGNLYAGDGTSWTFGIEPDPGYEIHDLVVDGTSAGPATSYTLPDIHEAHSIFAVFHSTTADVGSRDRVVLSIERLRFEAASHTIAVRFALPASGPARLELFDTTGRLQAKRDVGDLGPGVHEVRLGEGGRPAPGLYFVRLRQGDRAASASVAVVY